MSLILSTFPSLPFSQNVFIVFRLTEVNHYNLKFTKHNIHYRTVEFIIFLKQLSESDAHDLTKMSMAVGKKIQVGIFGTV